MTSRALPAETNISQAGTCQSPFDFRVVDQTEHLFQQLQVTTLPKHCHFSWRSKSVVNGQATMGKFHFQYLAVTRRREHKYFWPEILLLNPELPRTQIAMPPTPSFSFPTPKPIKKFRSKSSYVYNACSAYRIEVQRLLRSELSAEVLFPEIEVVPQFENRRETPKNNIWRLFLRCLSEARRKWRWKDN